MRTKRSKTALAERGWDAGPVIGDGQHGVVVPLGEGDGHRTQCVPGGVVEEVAQCACERSRIAGDLRGGDMSGVDGDHVRLAESARLAHDDVVEIDADQPLVIVEDRLLAGQQQQIVDQSLQVFGFGEDASMGCGEIGARGMTEIDFELGTDTGEWAAELVGGVGDETLSGGRMHASIRSSIAFMVRASRAISSSVLG